MDPQKAAMRRSCHMGELDMPLIVSFVDGTDMTKQVPTVEGGGTAT